MRNKTIFKPFWLLAPALCIAAVSCSVDEAYDLSKEIDKTVAVGNGLSIPIGSTDTIRLTEMIDPSESDVLNVTADGSYVMNKKGSFDAVDFDIAQVNGLHIEADIEEQHYSMDLEAMIDAENAIKNDPNIPDAAKEKLLEELRANRVAVSLYERIDKNDVGFEFHEDNLPEEISKIYKVEFDKPVRMHLEVDVMCEADPALFQMMDSLELSTAGEEDEHFYVSVPEYIKFVDDTRVNGNRLYLEGAVRVNDERNQFVMAWDFYIRALEFQDGYEIKNGRIDFDDKLGINGSVKSNIVTVEAGDIVDGYRTFKDVTFKPVISIDKFDIRHIEAELDVDIDDVNETVDLGLDNDLEFLYNEGTVLDFANPQLLVSIANNSVVSVASDVVIRGYDENGAYIEGSEAVAHFDVKAAAENRFFITNNGEAKEGYVAVKSDLGNLFRKLPHTIGFELKSASSTGEHVDIYLGDKMSVSGEYEVIIPLEFNEVALTYTETFENVLGDDSSEITDYVKNVELVSIDAQIANTVPAELTPVVVAYDADGKELKNVVVTVEGKVAAGKGMQDGRLTAPVKSGFKVLLSAGNNELGKLYRLDVELRGVGSGVLNSNEYIKIERMSLNIEKPIEIDLN